MVFELNLNFKKFKFNNITGIRLQQSIHMKTSGACNQGEDLASALTLT